MAEFRSGGGPFGLSLLPFASTMRAMSDIQFMRLALRLARRGYGMTSPNPFVA